MTSGEWIQLMAGVGLLIALFAFPVISIWLDERRKRAAGDNPANEPPVNGEQKERQYSHFRGH